MENKKLKNKNKISKIVPNKIKKVQNKVQKMKIKRRNLYLKK